jgi:hypothetical protein
MGFTVYLSDFALTEANGPTIQANSVTGRMAGNFETTVTTSKRRVSGSGVGEWTIGGTYDPVTQRIHIAVRSCGMKAKATDIPVEIGSEGGSSANPPITVNWLWGYQAPRAEEPATVLDALKPPVPVVIPTEREPDLLMVNSLPQTGLTEYGYLEFDLKDPEPQTITQKFKDESGLGERTNEWTIALIPLFNIVRLDRDGDGYNSFVSTDTPTLQMGIPGVTIAKSGWKKLASWEVQGIGPYSGTGDPAQASNSLKFTFKLNPPSRPTEGSTERNRPLQYMISSTIEGTVQHFMLIQDEVDMLRQEYIDHGVLPVPSRSEIVSHYIDGTFNVGNYNWIVDGGMKAALEKVSAEYAKISKDALRVVGGFRSPQRNKASGDFHPSNKHMFGRALDLAPTSEGQDAILHLFLACTAAGYQCYPESEHGRQVAPTDAHAKHVHVEW